jgi:hypothetical protein
MSIDGKLQSSAVRGLTKDSLVLAWSFRCAARHIANCQSDSVCGCMRCSSVT